jgi:hypothetical protein
MNVNHSAFERWHQCFDGPRQQRPVVVSFPQGRRFPSGRLASTKGGASLGSLRILVSRRPSFNHRSLGHAVAPAVPPRPAAGRWSGSKTSRTCSSVTVTAPARTAAAAATAACRDVVLALEGGVGLGDHTARNTNAETDHRKNPQCALYAQHRRLRSDRLPSRWCPTSSSISFRGVRLRLPIWTPLPAFGGKVMGGKITNPATYRQPSNRRSASSGSRRSSTDAATHPSSSCPYSRRGRRFASASKRGSERREHAAVPVDDAGGCNAADGHQGGLADYPAAREVAGCRHQASDG